MPFQKRNVASQAGDNSKKGKFLFKEFYSFTDISKATLAKKHKKGTVCRKRKRGGKRAVQIYYNKKVKKDQIKQKG